MVDLTPATAPLSKVFSRSKCVLFHVKEGLRRLLAQGLPDDEDLVRRCYGSSDFREGVAAFMAKRSTVWTGY